MAKEVEVLGPLSTKVGPQGGLGGEDVHEVVPKSLNAPDPLGLVHAGGKK